MDYEALARALLKLSPDLVIGGVVGVRSGSVGAVGSSAVVGADGVRSAVDVGVGPTATAVPGGGGGGMVESAQGELGVGSDWADAVSDVSNSSGVSGGTPGVVSDVVREVVKFGEVSGAYPDERRVTDQKSVEKGFYGTFVRRYEAKKALEIIRECTGVKLPKVAHVELALATFSAGTMPSAFVGGKDRLRSLAVVGDAAITAHLACSMYVLGQNVESMQALRSSVTTDAALREAMYSSGLVKCVSFPPGVDARFTKVTATAFEAFVGVLHLHTEATVVRDFLRGTGIVAG